MERQAQMAYLAETGRQAARERQALAARQARAVETEEAEQAVEVACRAAQEHQALMG